MKGPLKTLAVAGLVVLAATGVVLVSTALAQIGNVQRVGALFRTRDVVLVSNRTNLPIVRASKMMPGDTVRGVIRVGNFGRKTGTLWVRPRRQVDTRGVYGGFLSQRLVLRIVSVSRPKGTVWRGYVRDMGRLRLGTLRPGQVRRYRFIVQFRVRPPARSALHEELFMKSTYKTDWVFELRPRR